jgi:hypothetical protein
MRSCRGDAAEGVGRPRAADACAQRVELSVQLLDLLLERGYLRTLVSDPDAEGDARGQRRDQGDRKNDDERRTPER